METNRKNDMIVEREVARFLDENLYSNKELFKEYARTDDLDEQLSGSDLILSSSDGRIDRGVIDEKVAKTRANSWLSTFSLELSFINRRGEQTIGWFMDNTKKTEYYLFGWINKAEIPYLGKDKRGFDKWDTDKLTAESIKEFDYAIVSKKKLMKFLEKKGWTIEKIARQNKAIRERGSVKSDKFIDNIRFAYTPGLAEKPINLLVKREDYFKMSEFSGTIKKE